MNVLSLFDGMACGFVALKRAGIKVDNYFASEIDKYAIQIAMKNHPDIIQLGDINGYESWDLPKIDLIIGGSPCQGFSFAGKQLNFDDSRSALFFKFVECKWHFKPRWFLMENVKMKKEYQDAISELLEVEPVLINSALVSAQNRNRLYWCNWDVGQPEDKGVLYTSILKSYSYVKVGKSQTILSTIWKENVKSMLKRNKNGLIIFDIDGCRKLIPIECERLQTLPDNYTEGVSNTQRYKMIGNGWTIDVISWIFSQMPL